MGDVVDAGRTDEARQQLWARYDAGELTAEELDARLRALDQAGGDPQAVGRALDGPIRIGRRRGSRLVLAAALVVVVGAAAVVAGNALADDTDGGTAPGNGGQVIGGVDVEPIPGIPEPAVDCPELDDALARFEELDEETQPANPALLSDPVALPDGYLFGDEETIVPGTDFDVSMSVAAGTPPPVEILARTLNGERPVTMRAWRYESAEAAAESGLSVLGQAVCTYDMTAFEVPDRPEIGGSVVTGVIPTTAFASWRLGDRRFSVAVPAGVDGDAAATAAAQELAGRIAALEYDAATTAPAPG